MTQWKVNSLPMNLHKIMGDFPKNEANNIILIKGNMKYLLNTESMR